MIGYKAFSKDLTCRGFQFQENETYTINEPIEICKTGFHFCDVPINVLNYYKNSTDKYAIIEALGEILVHGDKLVTNKIRILKVINKQELLNLCGNNVFKVLTGEYHFKDNLLHRDNDLPAKIYINGRLIWYKNGLIHRSDDLPAVIYVDGTRKWIINNVLHRENVPAIIYNSGVQLWYTNNHLYKIIYKFNC